MSDKIIEAFDKEDIYDTKIAPLMTQIIEVCKEHKIPMLATFNYACTDEHSDGGNDRFCTTCIDGINGYQPPEIIEALHIVRHGAVSRPKMAAFTITTK